MIRGSAFARIHKGLQFCHNNMQQITFPKQSFKCRKPEVNLARLFSEPYLNQGFPKYKIWKNAYLSR
jgi:hypothetical protein